MKIKFRKKKKVMKMKKAKKETKYQKKEEKQIAIPDNIEKSGSWRTFKPKIDLKKCNRCWLCIIFCPHNCIDNKNESPVIDYSACTGCLICLRECPVFAITEEREVI